jgi:hypothetical protein
LLETRAWDREFLPPHVHVHASHMRSAQRIPARPTWMSQDLYRQLAELRERL